MDLVSFIITLGLVMDPFGNVPVFLSLLGTVPPARRRSIIIRELFIALGVLLFFLVFGRFILGAMHLRQEALALGGAVVLFLIALRMVFPPEESSAAPKPVAEPFIVPLAIPLVAGPSSISYLILTASQHPNRLGHLALGVLVAWLVSFVVLLLSSSLARLLGQRVLGAIERLMGMILVTLSIQMLMDGIKAYLGL